MQSSTRYRLVAVAGVAFATTAAIGAAIGTAAGLAGCSSCKGGGGAAKEDLSLLPSDSVMVVSVNVARMRETTLWRKVLEYRDRPENKKEHEKFVADCGFDPLVDVQSAIVGVPANAGKTEEFAAVVHGKFDEAKIAACAKQRSGRDLTTTEYKGKKLYNDPQSGKLYFGFLDGKTLIAGGGESVKRVVDLAKGEDGVKSVKDNEALGALIKKTKTGDAIWTAGLVGDDLRQRIQGMQQLNAARSMKDFFGSLDFATGFRVDASIDVATENEAKELATKLNEQVNEAKKNPQIMLLGLASTVEAIRASSVANTFKLDVNLTQAQVDALVERLQGLLGTVGGRPRGGIPGGAAAPDTTAPAPPPAP